MPPENNNNNSLTAVPQKPQPNLGVLQNTPEFPPVNQTSEAQSSFQEKKSIQKKIIVGICLLFFAALIATVVLFIFKLDPISGLKRVTTSVGGTGLSLLIPLNLSKKNIPKEVKVEDNIIPSAADNVTIFAKKCFFEENGCNSNDIHHISVAGGHSEFGSLESVENVSDICARSYTKQQRETFEVEVKSLNKAFTVCSYPVSTNSFIVYKGKLYEISIITTPEHSRSKEFKDKARQIISSVIFKS